MARVRPERAVALSQKIREYCQAHNIQVTTRLLAPTGPLQITRTQWDHIMKGDMIYSDATVYAEIFKLTGIAEADPRTIPPDWQEHPRAWTPAQYEQWLNPEESVKWTKEQLVANLKTWRKSNPDRSSRAFMGQVLQLNPGELNHVLMGNTIHRDPKTYARLYLLTGLGNPRGIPARIRGTRNKRNYSTERAWNDEQWQEWLASDEAQALQMQLAGLVEPEDGQQRRHRKRRGGRRKRGPHGLPVSPPGDAREAVAEEPATESHRPEAERQTHEQTPTGFVDDAVTALAEPVRSLIHESLTQEGMHQRTQFEAAITSYNGQLTAIIREAVQEVLAGYSATSPSQLLTPDAQAALQQAVNDIIQGVADGAAAVLAQPIITLIRDAVRQEVAQQRANEVQAVVAQRDDQLLNLVREAVRQEVEPLVQQQQGALQAKASPLKGVHAFSTLANQLADILQELAANGTPADRDRVVKSNRDAIVRLIQLLDPFTRATAQREEALRLISLR